MNRARSLAAPVLLLASLAALPVACAHAPAGPPLTPANAGTMTLRQAARSWREQAVALRQSHYFGELYDDNERMLLSPYAFATLYHRVDLRGQPITPGHPHGIVPAGTRVVVEAIELPGVWTGLHRMLNAPKDHVWVRLRLAGQEPQLAACRNRPLIVVLDAPIDTPAQLAAALDEAFAPPADVAAWLQARRPAVRAAIAHKQPMRGMDKDELRAALGEPWRWLTDADATGTSHEVAWYPEQEAWLLRNVVVDVRPARRP